MDLTLPENPGAILGYRRNGQPILLAAGASPDDPSNEPDDDPEAEPETGDDPEEVDWKAKYEEAQAKYDGQKKVNRDLERRYKRGPRPAGKPATGEQGEGEDDADEHVKAAIERELEAAARAAAYTVGGRAPELLDSLKFRKLLNKIDVEDADDFQEEAEQLFRAEVKKLPPKAPAGPARKQGADVSGGAAGRERPKGIAAAISARYNGGK